METPHLTYNDIFYVFALHPQEHGVYRRLLAKYVKKNGKIHVLEDHGLDTPIDKMPYAEADKFLNRLSRGQRTEVVNAEDIRQGKHKHLIPADDGPQVPFDLKQSIARQFKVPGVKTSKFIYHRQGHDVPQNLEIHGDVAFLDGHKI